MKRIYTLIAVTSLMLGLSMSAFAQNRRGNRSRASSGTPTQSGTFTRNVAGHQSNNHGTSARGQQMSSGGGDRPMESLSLNLKAAKPNNATINWGDGHGTTKSAKVQRQSQPGKPNYSYDFDGDSDVDSADFRRQNKAAQPYSGSANRKGILIGMLLPQIAEKTTNASSQPTSNNANPRVKKPRRYMEQDGIYR